MVFWVWTSLVGPPSPSRPGVLAVGGLLTINGLAFLHREEKTEWQC
jgi:hypothetical protein